MEQQELQDLITHPDRLNQETLSRLKELVKRYPYFQTAWILYLKNLFILQSPDFKEELRRGSLRVADLSVLFYYIEGDRFLIQKHKSADSVHEPGADRTLDLIDQFLSESLERPAVTTAREELSVPMEAPADYTSVLLSQMSEDADEEVPSQLHGHELIDQFIESSESSQCFEAPKIEDEEEKSEALPDDTYKSQSTEAEERTQPIEEEEPEESYFTETLAKIYVKQQRYDKALEIIKKLNLKYPKKNAYFADQIRFLEKLIINAKSK